MANLVFQRDRSSLRTDSCNSPLYHRVMFHVFIKEEPACFVTSSISTHIRSRPALMFYHPQETIPSWKNWASEWKFDQHDLTNGTGLGGLAGSQEGWWVCAGLSVWEVKNSLASAGRGGRKGEGVKRAQPRGWVRSKLDWASDFLTDLISLNIYTDQYSKNSAHGSEIGSPPEAVLPVSLLPHCSDAS